jgi:apolipoprotein N-acyltransferase
MVEPRRGATPYVRLGDRPVVVLALLLGLLAAARLPRRTA